MRSCARCIPKLLVETRRAGQRPAGISAEGNALVTWHSLKSIPAPIGAGGIVRRPLRTFGRACSMAFPRPQLRDARSCSQPRNSALLANPAWGFIPGIFSATATGPFRLVRMDKATMFCARTRLVLMVVTAFSLVASLAAAEVRRVPEVYPSVGAAYAAAAPGDVIEVNRDLSLEPA